MDRLTAFLLARNGARNGARWPTRTRTPMKCFASRGHYHAPVLFLYLTGAPTSLAALRALSQPASFGAGVRSVDEAEMPDAFEQSLLRRRRRARRAPERRQQVRLALPDLGEVLVLDVAEAADLL